MYLCVSFVTSLSDVLLCDPQALIPLALEGTELGKVRASHALAKIAAVTNPEMAFPGERVRTFWNKSFCSE